MFFFALVGDRVRACVRLRSCPGVASVNHCLVSLFPVRTYLVSSLTRSHVLNVISSARNQSVLMVRTHGSTTIQGSHHHLQYLLPTRRDHLEASGGGDSNDSSGGGGGGGGGSQVGRHSLALRRLKMFRHFFTIFFLCSFYFVF